MIEVKNITKKYGNFQAVQDLNFTVNDGEILGFLGPNGAGKSTTMNMITGYIEPTEGSIIVEGYDISKKPKQAKKQIGYMPENVPLYPELTVREFIQYMADLKGVKRNEKKAEIQRVMEATGLVDVQKKLIRNLSRGYKQRVSMAGALVGNPKVLILDEPTVGLDPKQVAEIRNLIRELGKTHTILLSSHILSEVSQVSKRVLIINKGKIVAIDTPENLETKAKVDNVLVLTVEDKQNHMKDLKKEVPEIKQIELKKENTDGTKQYTISSDEKVDIRKKLFEVLPKKDITIFELKKAEATLEDAFLGLINKPEETQKTENKKAEKKQEKTKKEKSNQTEKKDKTEKQAKTEKKDQKKKEEK